MKLSSSRKFIFIFGLVILLIPVFSFATSISDGVWTPRTWSGNWTPMHGAVQVTVHPKDIWARDASATYDPVNDKPNDLYDQLGRPTINDSGETIPYTHYIDADDTSCTDISNDGTVATPRCSLPLISDISAGDVIVVASDLINPRQYTTTLPGTATQPVFIWGVCGGVSYDDRFGGNNCPELSGSDQFLYYGPHLIMDGFVFANSRPKSGEKDDTTSYVSMRNIESHDNTKQGPGFLGTHFVYYRVNTHHHQNGDKHGFGTGPSDYFWILQSHSHHNGGDSIQWCHNESACIDSTTNTPESQYAFLDQNDFYSNRENGVDLKYTDRVLITRNRIWGHIDANNKEGSKDYYFCYNDNATYGDDQYNTNCPVFNGGSDGAGIILGANGGIGSINVWLVGNEFLDNTKQVRIESGDDAVVFGNKFLATNTANADYDITIQGGVLNDTCENSNAGSIVVKRGLPVTVAFNTFGSGCRGFVPDAVTKMEFGLVTQSNIFDTQERNFWAGADYQNCIDNSDFDYNFVYDSDGTATAEFCESPVTSITTNADLNGTIGAIAATATGNNFASSGTLFVDAANYDFSLASGAGAIDAGDGSIIASLQSTMRTVFNDNNLGLADFEGTVIPGNTTADSGALQSDGNNVELVEYMSGWGEDSNISSGSITIDLSNQDTLLVAVTSLFKGSTESCTSFTFNNVAGTEVLDVSNETTAGHAATRCIHVWTESDLPTTSGTYTAEVTVTGSGIYWTEFYTLSGVDQTTPVLSASSTYLDGYTNGDLTSQQVTGHTGEFALTGVWARYSDSEDNEYQEAFDIDSRFVKPSGSLWESSVGPGAIGGNSGYIQSIADSDETYQNTCDFGLSSGTGFVCAAWLLVLQAE